MPSPYTHTHICIHAYSCVRGWFILFELSESKPQVWCASSSNSSLCPWRKKKNHFLIYLWYADQNQQILNFQSTAVSLKSKENFSLFLWSRFVCCIYIFWFVNLPSVWNSNSACLSLSRAPCCFEESGSFSRTLPSLGLCNASVTLWFK